MRHVDETFPTLASTLEEARTAYDAGDFTRALALLRGSAYETHPEVGGLIRDCLLNLGEVSAALGEVTRLRRRADSSGLRRQARFMLGRLRETSTTWLPPVPVSGSHAPPRDRRILHLLKESLPYAQSGYTFRSRMTVAAQRDAGFDPVVITSLGFPSYAGQRAPGPEEVIDGVTYHRLDPATPRPLPLKKVPFDIVLTEQAARTAAIVERERPAIIQAHSGFRGYDQALVGLAIARAIEVPFIYEVRGFLEATWSSRVDLQERGEYYERRRAQDERCMTEADLVVTIAASMRDVLVERGIDRDKTQVIPNAVDVARFTPRAKDRELARGLGLGDRFVVGYISNLGRREGVEHLLRATATLIAQGREVACLVVGDGPERSALEQLGRTLGLGDAVVITGHVPNERIEDHYALIDAFVVPRIDDQAARLVTPLKPLEAMAMGVPVISSDLPALREIIAPGERGLVVPPGDAAAIAAAVATYQDEPATARAMADAASAWVHRERTLEANVIRYRDALDGLLG